MEAQIEKQNGKNYWLARRYIKGLSPRDMPELQFCEMQKEVGVGIYTKRRKGIPKGRLPGPNDDDFFFIMPNGELIPEEDN